MITVTLAPTHQYTRFPCLFCGGQCEKHAVLPFVFRDGKRTHHVACWRCLEDADLAATVRNEAARLRERAARLDTLAGALPALPSVAEWQAADRAEDARIVQGNPPLWQPSEDEMAALATAPASADDRPF